MMSNNSLDRHRVLLVDDDPALLKLVSLRLATTGLEVETVLSGEAALVKVPIFQPHLVVTDLRMEGMGGMALCQQLYQQYPTLPVIILTAHGTIQEAVKATRQGVFGFLTKPFDSKELLDQVQAALRVGGSSDQGHSQGKQAFWRDGIITRNTVMENLLRELYQVAQGDASVFVHGESGTGKELIANAVHKASPRCKASFVAINCSAVPEHLLESELFGHRRGAFTGAVDERKGLFQAADGGTLFLDEIGDMPKSFQVKLLRALQEHQIRPIGSDRVIPVDVRIVSASHQDLDQLVEEGIFRKDLYYRLNVVTLELPPLSEKREDIPLLAMHFLSSLSAKYSGRVKGFSAEAMDLLASYHWPGNVRQLHNVVEQVSALATTPIVPVKLVEKALKEKAAAIPGLKEARTNFERGYLIELLQLVNGNVSKAARMAQRNRTEFYKLLKRHHLEPSQFK